MSDEISGDDMNALRLAPKSLVGGVIVLVTAGFVVFILSPSALGAAAIALTAILGWWLLRGSRVAWVLVTCSILIDIVLSGPHFDTTVFLVVSVIVIVALLAPSSLRYVWSDRLLSVPPGLSAPSHSSSRRGRLHFAYPLLAQMAGWSITAKDEQRSFGLLAWRLGVSAVLLLIPMTSAYRWQRSSGSSFADFIADLAWVCWAIVVLGFLVALALAARQHLVGPSRSEGSS